MQTRITLTMMHVVSDGGHRATESVHRHQRTGQVTTLRSSCALSVRCCMHQLQLWTLIYSAIAADACNAHAILQLDAPLYQIATAPRTSCSMLTRRVQYVCRFI